MRKKSLFAIVALPWLLAGSATAQESVVTQMQFVRNLRARGYPDLAQQKLDELRSSGVDIQSGRYSLETARNLLAMATQRPSQERLGPLDRARTELAKNIERKDDTFGPQSLFEIARVSRARGHVYLSQAKSADNRAAQARLARLASEQFDHAFDEFNRAVQVLTESDVIEARLERALTLYNRGQCNFDLSDDMALKRHFSDLKDTQRSLEGITKDDSGRVGWLASAWLLKIFQDMDEPIKASVQLKRIFDEKGEVAREAQTLAKVFYIQGLPEDPTLKGNAPERYRKIQTEAKSWLKTFGRYADESERFAVQFEEGTAQYNEAQLLSQKTPKSAEVVALYQQAESTLASAAASNHDLAPKAERLLLAINYHLRSDLLTAARIDHFEDAYNKARAQYYLMQNPQTQKSGQVKTDGERRRDLLQALTRAKELAGTTTRADKLAEIDFLLTTTALAQEDFAKASTYGEALARRVPVSKWSADAAGYAIEADVALAQRDAGDLNRKRLLDLIDFVLSPAQQMLWEGHPVSNVAKYQLAMANKRDGNLKEAIAQLGKLRSDFAGYEYARSQLALLALEGRDKAVADADKSYFDAIARRELANLPALSPDADPTTAAMLFYARIEQSKLMYGDAAAMLDSDLSKASQSFREMGVFVDTLNRELSHWKSRLAETNRDTIAYSLDVMRKYARLGSAEVEYRKGNFARVLANENTGDVVQRVARLASAKGPIRLKDYQVVGEIIALALRAEVQLGKIAPAREILANLERIQGEDDSLTLEKTNIVRGLVSDLDRQVQKLKASGNDAQYRSTVKNFSLFIDELASKQGQADVSVLANFYASIEQPEKAAKQYAQLPVPPVLSRDPKGKLDEKEEKELQTYWYLRIQYARALRASGDFKNAKKVLDELLAHPLARQQLRAQKEEIHVLEDANLYGAAVQAWDRLMTNPSLLQSVATDPEAKKLYFDCYFYKARDLYRYSQTDKVKSTAAAKKYLQQAATAITRLQTASSQDGWQLVGPMFRELLESERPLREAVEQLKK